MFKHFPVQGRQDDCLLFQVITGGQYDVDVKIEGPNKQIIYQQQKMQYDSHQFTAQITGTYFKILFFLESTLERSHVKLIISYTYSKTYGYLVA